MNKYEFLTHIKENLKGFKKEEVNGIIEYYEEIIADKMNNGLTEEEAIESLGNVDDITNEIKANLVMKRSNDKTSNSLRNSLIILGICSSPILLPLGISFAVLYLSIYIILGAIIFSLGISGVAVVLSILLKVL